MLNKVVLPAPLVPITPTISPSPMATLTSRLACTPPKRIDRSRVSSTDIGDLHLLQPTVVTIEAVAGHPALHRTDLLTDAAGELDQVDQQQEGSDDQRRVGRRERDRPRHLGQQVLEAGDLLDEVG